MSQITPQNRQRRDFLRLSAATGVAAALTAGLAACGKGPESSGSMAAAPAAAADGTAGAPAQDVNVMIGYNNNSSWDPVNTTGSAFAMAAHNHIYEALFDGDPYTREPYAALASALPDAEALKGKDLTVTLREGATWHDGQPVVADDVVYTFERILNAEKRVLLYAFFGTWLDKVEKKDDRTVVLHMKFPFQDALKRLSVAKIVPRHAYEGKSDEWLKDGSNQIGSGPYRVTRYVSGSLAKFERYDKYNGPLKPMIKTMQWNVTVDASARVAQLTAAQGGMLASDNIPQDNIESLQQAGITVEGAGSMNMLALVFNAAKKPYSDLRVRQALFYAIDTDKLMAIAIKGKGKLASCYLNEENPSYSKASDVYAYNPDKAKALLAEAGVKGLKITLKAVNISWLATAVNTIKESWDAIGVETTLEVMDTAALASQMASKGDFDVSAWSSNPTQFSIDADLNIRWFYAADSKHLQWSGWDKTADYKKLEKTLNDALASADATEHKKLLDSALGTIAHQAVIYPVMHMQLFSGWHADKLEGMKALNYPGLYLNRAKRIA
ncbi:ABC transporter substrate-binding protein [Amphibiibacter pelophylacis]|uniref:ABC transporter substrate-binding protein n=1 Tax=Amphibiibacter pelophylacis TaxID=1799477 RepID=A0ACC6P215_9BURK